MFFRMSVRINNPSLFFKFVVFVCSLISTSKYKQKKSSFHNSSSGIKKRRASTVLFLKKVSYNLSSLQPNQLPLLTLHLFRKHVAKLIGTIHLSSCSNRIFDKNRDNSTYKKQNHLVITLTTSDPIININSIATRTLSFTIS